MSTSNLSHALTLVLSNHLESVTKQKHQHLSRFTHQSPTSYWLHHVCMYFQYSVFFNKFFGLFYIELMVSGNLKFLYPYQYAFVFLWDIVQIDHFDQS